MPAVKITLTKEQSEVLEAARKARGIPAGTLARLWMYAGAKGEGVNISNPAPEADPSQLDIFRKPGRKTAGRKVGK
jgi:hypothetical protein